MTSVLLNRSVTLTTLAAGVRTTAPKNETDVNMTFLTTLAGVISTVQRNSSQDDVKPFWSLGWRVFLSVSILIIMAVAIVGNLLVFIVILKNRGMRTRTNMFLFNLAISDFLCAIFDMPFSLITAMNGKWVFSSEYIPGYWSVFVCRLNGFGMPFLFVASIHTLMYTAVHKYVSIRNPMRVIVTKRLVLCMIVATWTWATVVGLVTAVSPLTEIKFKNFTTQCGPKYPNEKLSFIHFGSVVITCYVIPILIISGCCLGMYRRIRSHGKRMHQNTTMDHEVIDEQQRQLSFTLFIVLGAFFVTWTPWVGYSIYTVFIGSTGCDDQVVRILNPLTYWCGYLNSACNPVIYAFRSTAFRVGYKEVLYGKKCTNREQNAEITKASSFGITTHLSVPGTTILPFLTGLKEPTNESNELVRQIHRSASDSNLPNKLSSSHFHSAVEADAPVTVKLSVSSAVSANVKLSTSSNRLRSFSSSLIDSAIIRGSDAAFADPEAESIPSQSCETIDSKPTPFTRGRYNKNPQSRSVEFCDDGLQVPLERRGGSTKRASARKFLSSFLRIHLSRSRSDAYDIQRLAKKSTVCEEKNSSKEDSMVINFGDEDKRRTESATNYDPIISNERKCRTLDNRSNGAIQAKELDKYGRQTPKSSLYEIVSHHRPSIDRELMNESGPDTTPLSKLHRGMSIEKLDSALDADYGMRKRSATVVVSTRGKHISETKPKREIRRSISVADKCV